MNVMGAEVEGRSVALKAGAYLLAFVAAFFPALEHFWGVWNTPQGTYGFALLSVPAALYLMWLEVARSPSGHKPWHSAVVGLAGAVGVLLWFGAMRVGIEAVHAALLPLLFWLGTLLLFSWATARRLILPCFAMALALPMWDLLQGALVELTSLAVNRMVQAWGGLTVIVQGDTISMPSGSLVIESGCSGQRYLLVSMTLVALGATYYQLRAGRALLLCLLAVAMALLGNWLRVFIIVLVAYQSEMRSSLVADHETLGWGVFAVVFMPVFWLLARWQRSAPPASVMVRTHAARGNAVMGAGLALLLLAPAALYWGVPLARSTDAAMALPEHAGDWQQAAVLPAGCAATTAKLGGSHVYRAGYGAWAEVMVRRYPLASVGDEPLPEPATLHRDMQEVLSGQPGCVAADEGWRAAEFSRYRVGMFTVSGYGVARLLQVLMPLTGDSEVYVVKVNSRCLQCDPDAAELLLQGVMATLPGHGWATSGTERQK